VAIAGRLGLELSLNDFDRLARSTPFLLDLKPSGRFLMEDFYYAGGLPALLAELAPLLDLSAVTVTGHSLGENIAGAAAYDRELIRSLDAPLAQEGGLAVLRGSLAPSGAIIKPTAATPALLTHRGRAVVFKSYEEMNRQIDDESLQIRPEDVLVLQNCGPVGAPGMPEWGFLPIPTRLLQIGVRDMVRISDARMSGTAFGTVVVHTSPEAAVGGPLGLVQTGDIIHLDVPKRRLDLLLDDAEMNRRRQAWRPPSRHFQRGYGWLFQEHVSQADRGCDFDFLTALGRQATG
jgi:dihydroxy-acid dehydratase